MQEYTEDLDAQLEKLKNVEPRLLRETWTKHIRALRDKRIRGIPNCAGDMITFRLEGETK